MDNGSIRDPARLACPACGTTRLIRRRMNVSPRLGPHGVSLGTYVQYRRQRRSRLVRIVRLVIHCEMCGHQWHTDAVQAC